MGPPTEQPKRPPEQPRANHDEDNPSDKAAQSTARATWVIAFFTIILALVGGFTLYEVIAGGNDTHELAEQAKRQAAASVQQMGYTAALALVAKEQAEYAKTAADVAKNALEKVQRAFLNIGTIDSLQGRIENGVVDWRFIFGWQNDGATPTRNMEFHRSYETRADELPTDFTFPDYWDTPAPHRRRFMVAAPKSRVGMTPIVISIADIDQVIHGLNGHRIHLYVWGWTRYHDVFENTPWHLTEFCSELTDFLGSPLIPVSPGNTVTPVFTQCATHNCSDEDCPDYKQKTGESPN